MLNFILLLKKILIGIMLGISYFEREIIMQTHIENIISTPIVYMRHIGAYGEQNYNLMQHMKQWIQHRNLWDRKGIVYGIAWDNVALISPNECRYDVCFVTNCTFEDKSIHYGTLPTGKYLICEIEHTVDAVKYFYSSLVSTLTNEGRQLDDSRPILERYQFSLVEKGYCEFCVPIL